MADCDRTVFYSYCPYYVYHTYHSCTKQQQQKCYMDKKKNSNGLNITENEDERICQHPRIHVQCYCHDHAML